MPKTIILSHKDLINADGSFKPGGVEIRILGFKGNPECPDDGQIWIETYEGKTWVHIWNGDSGDPVNVELHPTC